MGHFEKLCLPLEKPCLHPGFLHFMHAVGPAVFIHNAKANIFLEIMKMVHLAPGEFVKDVCLLFPSLPVIVPIDASFSYCLFEIYLSIYLVQAFSEN